MLKSQTANGSKCENNGITDFQIYEAMKEITERQPEFIQSVIGIV